MKIPQVCLKFGPILMNDELVKVIFRRELSKLINTISNEELHS